MFRRVLLIAAVALLTSSSDAQVVYPHTLAGCLMAAEDGLEFCTDLGLYPNWMCMNSYEITVDLCHQQYAQ